MHPSPIFRETDKEYAFDFIKGHPFAMLAVNGQAGPVCAFVPLIREGAKLIGHVSRANPFWPIADRVPAIAVFKGHDHYISPSLYPSKKEHGRVVPTWNYLAVEVRGMASIIDDPKKMKDLLIPLTDKMEADQSMPCLLYTSPSPRDQRGSRMPSSA